MASPVIDIIIQATNRTASTLQEVQRQALSVKSTIESGFAGSISNVQKAFQSVGQNSAIVQLAVQRLTPLIDTVQAKLGSVGSTLSAGLGQAGQQIEGFASLVRTKLATAYSGTGFERVAQGVQAAIPSAVAAAQELTQQVGQKLQASYEASFAPGIVRGFRSAFDQAQGVVRSGLSKIREDLSRTDTIGGAILADVRKAATLITPALSQIGDKIRETVNVKLSGSGLGEAIERLFKKKTESGGGGGGGLLKSLFGDVKGLVPQLAAVQLAAGAVGGAFAAVQGVGQTFFDKLISPAVELENQLLSTKATLVATNQVFQGGVKIGDPTAAIKALDAPVNAAIDRLRKGSLELVGVTSQQLVPIFQNVAGQSAAIGATLSESSDLTLSFAAALGTLSIPLEQQRQEVSSILQANITSDSTLAKSLNITNDQVKAYKAQGTLVEQLNKRLEAFRSGNALAAQTISGVGSNIQEIFDNIFLAAGRPFIKPIVAQLNEVYQFLQDNQDGIGQFISQVASAVFQVAQGVISVGKTILDTIGLDNIAKVGQVAADAFSLAGSFVEGFAIRLNDLANSPDFNVIKAAFDLIGKSAEGLSLIPQVFSEVSGATGATNDAIESLGQATDDTAQRALGLQTQLKALSDAEKIQGGLTDEQKAKRAALSQQIAVETQGIQGQIDALKSLQPQNEAQRNSIKVQIALLEQLQTRLSDVKLAANPISDKGTALSQLQKQAEDFETTLKAGVGDPALYENAAKGFADITQKQLDAGLITAEEASRRFQSIASNSKLGFEQQLSAQESALKAAEAASRRAGESNKADQAELQAQIETGQVGEAEGVRRLGELKEASIQQELALAEQSHKMKLQFIEQELKASLAKADEEVAAAQKELDDARANGDEVATAQAERALQGSLAKRQRLEQSANNARTQADEEFSNKKKNSNAQLEQNEIETQRKITQTQLDEIDRRQAAAEDAIAESEVEAKIAAQKLINAGARPEDVEVEKVKATKARIQQELQLEKDKLAELEALPPADNPKDEEKRQNLIRDSRRKTKELTLNLLEQEKAAQEALTRQIQAQIETELQKKKNAFTAQTQELQKQVDLQDALTKSLDAQLSLLNARQALQKSYSDYAQGQFDIAQRLLQTEDDTQDKVKQRQDILNKIAQATSAEDAQAAQRELERFDRQEEAKQIQIEAAKARIESLQFEQELERQSNELEQEKARILLEQEKIKARIAQIQQDAEIAGAKAELAKLQADPTTRPEALRAAQLNIQAQEAKADALRQQNTLLEQQASVLDDLQAAETKKLDRSQGLAFDQARADLAALTPGTQDDRALARESLANARQARAGIRADAAGLPGGRQTALSEAQEQAAELQDGIQSELDKKSVKIKVEFDKPGELKTLTAGKTAKPTPGSAPKASDIIPGVPEVVSLPVKTPTPPASLAERLASRDGNVIDIPGLTRQPPQLQPPQVDRQAPIQDGIQKQVEAALQQGDILQQIYEVLSRQEPPTLNTPINNYFQGSVDQKQLRDSQQETLATLQQVLRLGRG